MTLLKRWYPPPFNIPGDINRIDLDTAFKTAFDQIYSLNQQAVLGAETGFSLAAGSLSITGSQKGVATGLSLVSNVVACISASTASNYWITAQPSPNSAGRIDIYVWQPTASGNNTPIAATSPVTVAWQAIGAA